MSSGFVTSPAIIAAVGPPSSSHDHLSSPSIFAPISLSSPHGRSRCLFSISRKNPKPNIRCEVSVDADADLSSPTVLESEEDEKGKAAVGARVRVTAPLKVYHVVRVPEVELEGMEGFVKDYVALWKGKRISANLPYKVQFVKEIEGRGPVKFFTHLKEDEFEFIDT